MLGSLGEFQWSHLLTVIGLFLTAGIAFAGFRTFNRWKREKLEEKRIEVAIEALAIAYEAKAVFRNIRIRLMSAFESQDMPKIAGETETDKAARASCYVVLKRIDAHYELFERASRFKPKLMAVFGAQHEDPFHGLDAARSTLAAACNTLMKIYAKEQTAKDHTVTELRGNIWGGDEDAVTSALNFFVRRIEELCHPVIDSSAEMKKPPR